MTSPVPPHPVSILLEEYKEVGANLRQYGNMRFAQLTLFVGVTGGLLAALFGKDTTLLTWQKLGGYVFGLLLTGAFWVMEERATDWWNRYYKRAVQIEADLNLRQYGGRKVRPVLSATRAVRAIFAAVTVVWLLLLASGIRAL